MFLLHSQRPALRQSFDLNVPWIPEPLSVAGKSQLVYELQMTNGSSTDLSIRRIEVLNARSGAVIAAFEGSALSSIAGAKPSIPPAFRAVAYITVPFAPTIRHRITYVQNADSVEYSVDGGSFTSRSAPLLSLGPPLRGGPWAAIYSDAWERGHRRVQYAINGAAHIPGRFAIDWIRVDDQGRHAAADPSKLANWYGYGVEVLAVADAVVAAANDGIPEPTSVGTHPKAPLEDAAGNYVALDLGHGRFAFYEHLKPGSIRPTAGGHVRRGDVIGLLGYTGDSTGPHLHFHVADGGAPLDAEGLPYVLQDLNVLGVFSSIEGFSEGKPWQKLPFHSKEFPAPLSVVRFP